MPRYEFHCESCESHFEKEMPIAERSSAEITCPECGGAKVEQVFRAVRINTRKASCDEAGGCGAPCGCCCGEC